MPCPLPVNSLLCCLCHLLPHPVASPSFWVLTSETCLQNIQKWQASPGRCREQNVGTTGSRAAGKESRGRSWTAAGRRRRPKISSSGRESDILSNLFVAHLLFTHCRAALYTRAALLAFSWKWWTFTCVISFVQYLAWCHVKWTW